MVMVVGVAAVAAAVVIGVVVCVYGVRVCVGGQEPEWCSTISLRNVTYTKFNRSRIGGADTGPRVFSHQKCFFPTKKSDVMVGKE